MSARKNKQCISVWVHDGNITNAFVCQSASKKLNSALEILNIEDSGLVYRLHSGSLLVNLLHCVIRSPKPVGLGED